jgi:predicted dinucleotide-binding enzyme
MRIGIVGADELGSTLAELWTNAGHQVAVGDPAGPDAAAGLAERLGPSVSPTTVEDAARLGEIVVLSVPFDHPEMLPSPAAVAGKIVIDAMNALTGSGEVMDLGGRSSSTIVAERYPHARVVKALNTVQPETLRTDARTSVPRDRRFVIFLAGDDVRANAAVSRLIEELGFTPIDTGSLARGGRFQEPGSQLFHRQLLPAEARRVLRLMA